MIEKEPLLKAVFNSDYRSFSLFVYNNWDFVSILLIVHFPEKLGYILPLYHLVECDMLHHSCVECDAVNHICIFVRRAEECNNAFHVLAFQVNGVLNLQVLTILRQRYFLRQ